MTDFHAQGNPAASLLGRLSAAIAPESTIDVAAHAALIAAEVERARAHSLWPALGSRAFTDASSGRADSDSPPEGPAPSASAERELDEQAPGMGARTPRPPSFLEMLLRRTRRRAAA